MKPTIILGAASALMRSKRAKLLFLGLQFGYLTYRLVKEKRQKDMATEHSH
ncbi:hypothetical protein [Maribacter sp. 2307ULW6-5]|uniref:hypothetical protein n=1 Tax=Maribacter sp. 2307ULW6-5 TaxID=3386275 RepID=UPI0039BC41D9